MSHYTVAVFTEQEKGLSNKDSEDRTHSIVEESLEPFWEGLEVSKYVLFTKEELIKCFREGLEAYKESPTYKEYLSNPVSYKEKYSDRMEHILYLEEEFPRRLKMSDAEIYTFKIEGYSSDMIGPNGELYSTSNPNSKWDWYSIGGRWNNLILGKDGKRYNSLPVSEIDLSVPERTLSEHILFWEIYVEGQNPVSDRDKDLIKYPFYKKEYYIERYGAKENYANIQSRLSTYAVLLPDGTWLEPGEMGSFGMSGASMDDTKAWDEGYPKILNMALQNDWVMTIVDCHI